MRKSRHLLAALACVLALGTESIAQEQVRKLEFEAGLGYSLAMTKEEHYGSLSALLELRYNLRHSPWDVGIHYENSVAPLESVDYEALYDISPGFNPTGTTDEDIHYIPLPTTISIGANDYLTSSAAAWACPFAELSTTPVVHSPSCPVPAWNFSTICA